MSEYTQKYAFVTGSSRGIGRAIALRLAAEGYHIFLNCARSFDALEETRREIETIGTCTLVPGDIGNPDTVREIFHTIAKTCDHLDVLVNNAGISHIGLLMDMTDEDWDKVLSSNLSSVFYCCRAAIPPMLSHGSGRIINISSTSGLYGTPKLATYCMSKWGILGLTKTLAKEVGPKGIIVNALCPTKVKTPMCETMDYVQFINDLTGKNFATVEEMFAGVPFLEVEDIASMVYWMGTSREAGKFNGREVALDLGTLQ